jgi:hypothetical protein
MSKFTVVQTLSSFVSLILEGIFEFVAVEFEILTDTDCWFISGVLGIVSIEVTEENVVVSESIFFELSVFASSNVELISGDELSSNENSVSIFDL